MSVHDRLLSALGTHRGVAAADQLCAVCVEVLSVDEAAISIVLDDANTGVLGASSTQARGYDDLQFTFGEGPFLDSVATGAPVLVGDLAAEVERGRWPVFGPALLAEHVVGVFAVPVVVAGEVLGALDLYRRRPGPLDGAELAGALLAARLAEMPLLDLLAQDLRDAADPDGAAWAELGLLARAEVNQATGMLVAQLDIDPAAALVRLRAHAFATGASVTDVARAILERNLKLERDR